MSACWLFRGTPDELLMYSGMRDLKKHAGSGYLVAMILNSGLVKISSTENVMAHVRTWQNTAKKIGKMDVDVKTIHVSMALGRDAMQIRNSIKKNLSHHLVEGTDLYQVSEEEMDEAFRTLYQRWLEIKEQFQSVVSVYHSTLAH